MMNETDEMRQARQNLQLLSASDPAATSNMMRYVAATSLMLTGRLGRDRSDSEPQVVAGFRLTHGDHKLCAAATRRGGVDVVYLAFDVDDASAPPLAIGAFRNQDGEVALYGACRLWSPATDGRAVLVPNGDGDYLGYLAFRPGRQLVRVDAPLPGDEDGGYRRAASRMKRLLDSHEVRAVRGGGYMHLLQNQGQEVFAETSKLAA